MERLKGIRGAIFDLDGTLLDSLGVWSGIDRAFLAKRGLAVPPDYMKAVSAMDFSTAARYTIGRFDLKEAPEQIVEEWRQMACHAYAHELALKPGVEAYLKRLARQGVRLGVATSGAPELFRPALANNGVDDLFAAAVTTQEVGKTKASPEVYLEAARRLGLEPRQCAVFEDLAVGACSAKQAGFLTVGVYDRHAGADAEILQREADIYIRSFEELLEPACF